MPTIAALLLPLAAALAPSEAPARAAAPVVVADTGRVVIDSAHGTLAAPLAAPLADDDAWRPIVAVDEVSVALETRTVERTVLGARVTALTRWRYHDRAAAPTAWDAGARSALMLWEFDCGNRAVRVRASTPLDAAGARVERLVVSAASTEGAEWRAPRDGSMGAMVLAAVCAATR